MGVRKGIAFCENRALELKRTLAEEVYQPEWDKLREDEETLHDISEKILKLKLEEKPSLAAFSCAPPREREKKLLVQKSVHSRFVLLIASIQYLLEASAILSEIDANCPVHFDPDSAFLVETAHRIADIPFLDQRSQWPFSEGPVWY